MRPLFQLDPRLSLCASFVPAGAKLADIGTDHGYLPIWLAKTGRVLHAVAADLRPGPLERAKENVRKYQVEDIVELRLSDGLQAFLPEEADFIVIAGMGGEVIASILGAAPWLKETGARLVLQPMTRAEELRRFLAEHGFEILEERPVLSLGRPYSVLLTAYTGRQEAGGILFPYLGNCCNRRLPIKQSALPRLPIWASSFAISKIWRREPGPAESRRLKWNTARRRKR